jgi:predicted DsbA family dithiol-disulfide isomerase
LFVANVGLAAAQSGGGINIPETAATIAGEPISGAEVREAARKELERLESTRIQFEAALERDRAIAVQRALAQIAEDRLLQREADKRGLTVKKLLETEIDPLVKPPTDEIVQKFYEANKSRITGSLADNSASIQELLRRQERQQVMDLFLARLAKDHAFTSYLGPKRESVALTPGLPVKGPANAPVTIIEFGDFECPYCGRLAPVLNEILKTYEGRVRVVFRQFPVIEAHPRALKAAEASLCAHEQGKFWAMHDAMFQDQQALEVSALKEKAASIGLDSARFNQCLDTGKHVPVIRGDMAESEKLKIAGTPTLFINGRRMVGEQSAASLSNIIDEELRARPNQK